MRQPYFQFKQFTIWHDKCAMKVGTDGVLLGAWTSVGEAQRILDIGTGTGLVALMLAQRSLPAVNIVALEIDEAGVKQARENVKRSPWKNNIKVLQQDFNQYKSAVKFDIIVCNPPYFVDSLECPDQQRNKARHNTSLTYTDLLRGVADLLTKNGVFTIIIPIDMEIQVKEIAAAFNMFPSDQLLVKTKPDSKPKRTLISFVFQKKECRTEELILELARHVYSEEYILLTKDYYLKLHHPNE